MSDFSLGSRARRLILCACVFGVLGVSTQADEVNSWQSSALGRLVPFRILQEASKTDSVTVIRLAGLRGSVDDVRKVEKEPLRGSSYRIIELDYARAERASFPFLSQDIAKLRDDIFQHGLFAEMKLNVARIFVLPEGYALKTDVLYFPDAERPLFMDIAYPVGSDEAVPCLLEFSCDNANRMGNFSLAVCRDALLEGMATAGYAIAMADHPVPPPYKGIDSMPDCGLKVKAAVRTLRGVGRELGLSRSIGVAGFSRGSGMALLLATSAGMDRFEVGGLYSGEDSSIQAGVVLSGRFTYLDLLPDDRMWPRYVKVWGEREANLLSWKEQGALDYLEKPTIPLFLSINSGEEADAQHQMRSLREQLASLGNAYEYYLDGDGTGHKVPVDPAILIPMERYLRTALAGDTR